VPPASRAESPADTAVKAQPPSSAPSPGAASPQPMMAASKPAEPASATGVGPRKP
jgi:hypothetical protein